MSKIHKIPTDLFIILTWIIATFIFVTIPTYQNNIIRTILGFPMVLFIPGYVLIMALFPKKKDLFMVEKLVLSSGLSIALIILLGLFLNFTFGIRLVPIIFALFSYSIIMLFIAVYRRTKLPDSDRLSFSFNNIYNKIIKLKPKSKTEFASTIILVFMIILAICTILFVIIMPKTNEKFTEFYIINSSGKADDYTTNLRINSPTTMMIGITNHEYSQVSYTLQIDLGKNIFTSEEFILNHEDVSEKKVTFRPNKTGNNMKLEFLLFKENNFSIPYRELHMWVNVT